MCFFMTATTLVFGILRAMGAEPGMWETVRVLFDLTINPSIKRFGELEVRADGSSIEDGLSHMVKVFFTVWIMLGNIVLLNVLIAMMNSTYGQVGASWVLLGASWGPLRATLLKFMAAKCMAFWKGLDMPHVFVV